MDRRRMMMGGKRRLFVFRKGAENVSTGIVYSDAENAHSFGSNGISVPKALYIALPEKWQSFEKLCFRAYGEGLSAGRTPDALGVFKMVMNMPTKADNGIYKIPENGESKLFEFSVAEIISGLEGISVTQNYKTSIGIICGSAGKIVVENIWFE